MSTENSQDVKYRIFKTLRSSRSTFVNMADIAAVEEFRSRHGNQDLLVSTWYSAVPDILAPRTYFFRFRVVAADIEKTRRSALEACLYITETFGVSQDCIEVLYKPGVGCGAADDNDTNHPDSPPCQFMAACGNRAEGPPNTGTHNKSTHPGTADRSASAAEMVILVPPSVFGSHPTPLMPAMNHHLAHQMADDGVSHIDLDVYGRDSYIALPNCLSRAASRFTIPLTQKELLFMDGNRITELARQPRPDDSMIVPQEVPDAVEWFTGVLVDFEKQQHRQHELRKAILDDGWEMPPCIRRLLRLCLYDHVRLAAYRTISRFLSWIGASESEIRFQIHSMDRRNPIKDYQKLNSIVTFAVENPWFVGCEHALLRQFCPAGGCFMTELTREHQQPYLFGPTGERR